MSGTFFPEQEVLIKSLNKKGVILKIYSKKIKVNVNHIEFETTKDDLIALEKKVVQHNIKHTIPTQPQKGNLSIDVHGYTIDQALSELEGKLSHCFQRKIPYLKVIHGRGKGILKKVIIEYLQSSELNITYTIISTRHCIEIKINL